VTKFPSSGSRRESPRYSLPMMAGEKAPNFTLCDHTGRARTLSALLAEGVVPFFFPLASSPICTAQACHFRDLSNEFAWAGTQLEPSTLTEHRRLTYADVFRHPIPMS
jgi:thioredoxin-dependent peroxiredoxin